MITLLDCAVLAEDVYSQEHNNLARQFGWVRLDGQSLSEGFAAGVYEKDYQRIIACRSTDDIEDALADAQMVPLAELQRVGEVTPTVLRAYGLQDNMELSAGAQVIGRLLNSRSARMAIALHKNTPAIGFNPPFMGDLQGVRPVSTPNILRVNTRGEPLSPTTRTAGYLSHIHNIELRIERFSLRQPQRPTMPAYTSPVSYPRTFGAHKVMSSCLSNDHQLHTAKGG